MWLSDMEMRPLIYSAALSSQSVAVATKSKVTISVVAEDVETFYCEKKYARSDSHDLIAGQQIGVI